MAVTDWVRAILLGRPHGIRATLRRATGVLAWIDKQDESEPEPSPRETTTAGEEAPPALVLEGWTRVLEVAELPPGEVVEVFVDGLALVLVNVEGSVYALESTCPHAGGPLADGGLDGCQLTCPWHGWSFDVTTGQTTVTDDVRVPTYPARLEVGGVFVQI